MIRVSKNFAKTNPSEDRQLFAELKRRNVYKVAVAYAVIGWLMFPRFPSPRTREGVDGILTI